MPFGQRDFVMSAPSRHLGDGILLLVLLLVRGHSLGVICRDLMLPSVRAARQILFAVSRPLQEIAFLIGIGAVVFAAGC